MRAIYYSIFIAPLFSQIINSPQRTGEKEVTQRTSAKTPVFLLLSAVKYYFGLDFI